MTIEQTKTLEGLQTAIQMEIDGKKYYTLMGDSGGNEMGIKLFKQLAIEEDYHLKKFEAIYKAIQAKQDWPDIKLTVDHGKSINNIFSRESADIKNSSKATSSELKAVQKAMEMENKTRDFYKERAAKGKYEAEKNYYEILAGEESGHHAVLYDYYEYIKDPVGWYTMKERHSLDGG
jgi:rubrerythrin